MKKVLIITYYWPPSGGAGVQRCLKFVKYFKQFDIEPIVLTVDPTKATYPIIDNSLTADIPDDLEIYKTDSFEALSFYKKFFRTKQVPHSGFANTNNDNILQIISRFVRGNFLVPDARIGWNKFVLKKSIEIIQKHNIDTVFISTPPHSTQLIGLELKKRFNIKWIADMRDPWTDIYYYDKLLHLPFVKANDKKLEQKVIETADHVITVSNAIKDLLSAKSETINKNKIAVIPNGFDQKDFETTVKPDFDIFTITYTGTIAENYNIKAFVNAIKRIIETKKDIKIQLRFVGNINPFFEKLFESAGISNIVNIIKYVPHQTSIEYLKSSVLLLLVIPEQINNEGIITGKIFEYLASRRPIVCIGPQKGEAAKIINECTSGSSFDYYQEDKIFEHILGLVNQWQETKMLMLDNNDTYMKYSRQNLTKTLAELINS